MVEVPGVMETKPGRPTIPMLLRHPGARRIPVIQTIKGLPCSKYSVLGISLLD